jgi:hypothetical protein
MVQFLQLNRSVGALDTSLHFVLRSQSQRLERVQKEPFGHGAEVQTVQRSSSGYGVLVVV